jgi:hypothetical protein
MGKIRTSLIILSAFASFLLIPACKEKPKNPVAEYGNNLMNAYKGAQNAADIASLDGMKKAVEAYRASNGSYPAELKDVGALIGGPVDFSKFDYDPSTGAVTLKPQK